MALVASPPAKGDYVLVCKLDASWTEKESATVCMAGYIAMLPAWLEFEQSAAPIFDRYGVTVLHAKEFYDTDGEFEGWSRDKKEAFIRDIQHKCILGRLDAGIIFAAPKAEWKKAKAKHNLAHQESAFGFCFRAIIDQIFGDVVIGKALALGETLTFVLESGDQNAEDAKRIFNRARAENEWIRQKLYSFGYAPEESARGLQIADFLAVTSRKYIDSYNPQIGYPPEPPIVSILRERIYLIDQVAVSFFPTKTGPVS
jgi:hypothetical protein